MVIYLNSPPTEPRERDYIYTGSYYAYCFWIGFAVIALAETFTRFTKNLKTAGIIATLLCFTAPVLMAKDGWDDHDRSKRYFSVDAAINYLQSCAPNAALLETAREGYSVSIQLSAPLISSGSVDISVESTTGIYGSHYRGIRIKPVPEVRNMFLWSKRF